jgi:hypothetical protein
MATLSLCGIVSSCLGLTGNISVNSDPYGYIFRDSDGLVFGTLGSNDTLPGSGAPTTRSLKRHLQTISGRSSDQLLGALGQLKDLHSRHDVALRPAERLRGAGFGEPAADHRVNGLGLLVRAQLLA